MRDLWKHRWKFLGVFWSLCSLMMISWWILDNNLLGFIFLIGLCISVLSLVLVSYSHEAKTRWSKILTGGLFALGITIIGLLIHLIVTVL